MRHLTRAPGMLIRKENAASMIWLRFLAGPPAKSDVAVLACVASCAPSSCEDVASRVRQAIKRTLLWEQTKMSKLDKDNISCGSSASLQTACTIEEIEISSLPRGGCQVVIEEGTKPAAPGFGVRSGSESEDRALSRSMLCAVGLRRTAKV